MSNIIKHSHSSNKNQKEKNNSLLVIVISLLLVIGLLFGLNYFLTSKNKNNLSVIEKVVDSRSTIGNADAKIKLVEYADFECPACSVFSKVFPDVLTYINGKYGSSTLSLTYKYFPLVTIHKNALLSAYSAEAAKNQDKFWEMHDVLFEKQEDWGQALDAKSKIEGYAREMGLDMNKFILDRDSENTKDIVNKSLLEATKLGLDHTPFIFMNGQEMKDLSLNLEDIKKVIEDKINNVVASSTNQ